jgi:hypothetical protein
MAGHLVWDQPPGTQIATSMCLSERVGLAVSEISRRSVDEKGESEQRDRKM